MAIQPAVTVRSLYGNTACSNCVRSLYSLTCPDDPLIHPQQLFVTAHVFINHNLHGVQLTTGKPNGLTFSHIIHVLFVNVQCTGGIAPPVLNLALDGDEWPRPIYLGKEPRYMNRRLC
jgi:hypothetical protein